MNVSELIKTHPVLKNLDFLTVYKTIQTLIDDGYLLLASDVSTVQS